jgi:uncharacterized iron-regulated protein
MRLAPCGFLALILGFVPWMAGAMAQDRASFDAVALDAALPLDKLAAQLASKRVVFVGEIHDRYDHHLNQLEIIRKLHELDSNMAIGVEYFQQPFQQQVDDYIAGRIPENEFLRATEYYSRWGYDYRLYAPIFRYAREEHIPVRALNVPTALVSAVARVGISGLAEKQRAYLPREIEPDRRMVILAGAGHVEFGSGIPKRLARRTKATYAIVLSSGEDAEPQMADYLLLSKKQDLPPAGTLNVSLKEKDGECRISSLISGGAGEKAGLRKGDVLVAVNAQAVKTAADVRLALWDKQPGDRAHIEVRRKRLLRSATTLSFEVPLARSPRPL